VQRIVARIAPDRPAHRRVRWWAVESDGTESDATLEARARSLEGRTHRDGWTYHVMPWVRRVPSDAAGKRLGPVGATDIGDHRPPYEACHAVHVGGVTREATAEERARLDRPRIMADALQRAHQAERDRLRWSGVEASATASGCPAIAARAGELRADAETELARARADYEEAHARPEADW